MSFFADVRETSEQYGKYITEFQELFRANDVSFGTPEDFFRLAPRLARDDGFREAFTALAKSVQQREESRLTVPRMLTIVAMAMGGKEIENVGDAGAVPVSLMVVFLAGIGGWSEKEPALVGVAAAGATAGESASRASSEGKGDAGVAADSGASSETEGAAEAKSAAGGGTDDEREAMELERRLTAGPEENIEETAASLFGGPAQVKEALSRLEMNTLQLKMHLDSIDSRMERIEPHLDDIKSRFSAQPEAGQRTDSSGESVESLEPVPVPPMKPWPKDVEEPPEPEWEASAPPMKPWPAQKEQDLVWEPRPGEKTASTRATWPAREAEPEWRVPREQEPPVRESFSPHGRTLAHGAAPLRMEPEYGPEYDDDLPMRVPFDEYLKQEEGSGWGRRAVAVLGIILIGLAVGGGLFYRSHGWHGFNDAVQTVGASFAEAKTTVTQWVSSQRAGSPDSSAASTDAAKGTAPVSSQAQPASTTPAVPPASQPPAQAASASPVPASAPTSPATTQPPAPGPASAAGQAAAGQGAAEQENDTGSAHGGLTGSAADEREKARATKGAARGVVTVIAGSGMASEDASPGGSAQGVHSTVPIFVDEARLSVVSDPRPEYPPDALARGIAGEVVVQAIIARNGDVESAQIVSGTPGLLKSSVDAVREWRFRPYTVRGQPVEARTYVRFEYRTER